MDESTIEFEVETLDDLVAVVNINSDALQDLSEVINEHADSLEELDSDQDEIGDMIDNMRKEFLVMVARLDTLVMRANKIEQLALNSANAIIKVDAAYKAQLDKLHGEVEELKRMWEANSERLFNHEVDVCDLGDALHEHVNRPPDSAWTLWKRLLGIRG